MRLRLKSIFLEDVVKRPSENYLKIVTALVAAALTPNYLMSDHLRKLLFA